MLNKLVFIWYAGQGVLTLACAVGVLVQLVREPKLTQEEKDRLIYRS